MDKQAKAREGGQRSIGEGPFFSGFNGQAMRMAFWPMELWLQWQSEVLKAAAPATAEWMERRREGTDAALRTFQRLCACEDANDAAKIQSEWVNDESQRLKSDLESLSSPALFWPQVGA
jgi:hypothetical protein